MSKHSPWLRKPIHSLDAYAYNKNANDNNLSSSMPNGENYVGGVELTKVEHGSTAGGGFSPDINNDKSFRPIPENNHHDGAHDDKNNPDNISMEETQSRNKAFELERHLTLFDLVSLGVGGTVGSGIFVLCGLIAREHAGPATCVSWMISGLAAFLSGFCYAELSGRIPSAGSSYAYAYASMGELPAFVTAACLTLEFLVSGSAVARSWGDKVTEWLIFELHADEASVTRYLNPGYGINPMAFLVSFLSTILVLCGVKESKIVMDMFTWIKVLLVIFMTIGGFILMDTTNLKPFVPPQFGVAGVMRGATTSFFGYLGYDGICCVAGEAKNPKMNLPRSIMITLGLVTVLYVLAALALTGMQDYRDISSESGFPEAFQSRGVNWAAQLTAAGEVFTLPVVVLLSVIIQPRLQYALAIDGLLPPFFSETNPHNGTLTKGTIFAGSVMTIIATFIPFTYLDDFVSAGILVAFIVTNSSLVVMRYDSPENRPFLVEKSLGACNALSFGCCILFVHGSKWLLGKLVAVSLTLATGWTMYLIARDCPRVTMFGGKREAESAARQHVTCDDANIRYFVTPFMPYIPCLGCLANWYLIVQLEISGILLLMLYFALSVGVYFFYGAKYSVMRNSDRCHLSNEGRYDPISLQKHQEEDDEDGSSPCIQHDHTIT
eukprot:CAMPEP_0195507076 /NCGR_PEP_ID=MMETSP0794_2-20130614/596_1 /TAXON_ID=515487 /ORGANISM="Stephanopyxis turris, Strain CCMP 815" /LENGTH=663 /DNA_ID=CAMNT_0040633627 /DNA_START=151 /DNA_END=2142 /DNA_ORIENTATION=-